MDLVPENVLCTIVTTPAASMVAPASRFSSAVTWNSETEPPLMISRPLTCSRALAGLLKLLSEIATLLEALMVAPFVLLRRKFDFSMVTFPTVGSTPVVVRSAPAPVLELVTLIFVRKIFFCPYRVIPVWLGSVNVRLLRLRVPPQGFVGLPITKDTLLNVLVPMGSSVLLLVFQPPVMVRSAMLRLLRLKLLKSTVDSPPL